MNPMHALDDWNASGVVGLFTDIDDTLTTDGRMPAQVDDALERLHFAGIRVVPVTGRSAGWAHMAMHLWPVEAVIAESGGVCIHRGSSRRLQWLFHAPPEAVRQDRERLAAVAQTVLRAVPGLAPASDNPFRLVDIALDYCEEVDRVPDDQVALALAMFRQAGFSARASTVHVNAWSGDFDKAPMALRYLREVAGERVAQDIGRWVFIGDAPNDVSMFEAFPVSIGVANVLSFVDRMSALPTYVTKERSSAGFVEFAEHLLSAARGGARAPGPGD